MSHARPRLTNVTRVAVTALVALLGSLGLAGTASAAAGHCPSGYTCLRGDSNYETKGVGTALVRFHSCHHDLRLSTYASTTINANDSASSVSNNGTQSAATFYIDILYAGSSFTLAKGTGDGNLSGSSGNAPGGYNDRLSSAKFVTMGAACR